MDFNYSPELWTMDRLHVLKSENILGFRYEVFLSDTRQIHTCICSQIYTYKRVVCVCLFVCWFVCFLSATRHLSTMRRYLRVAESRRAVVAGGPARAGASMHSESTRAHAVLLLNEKNRCADAFQKQNRTRAHAVIRNCRDFHKMGERKPTCHFPSSVYSLPSLGVFTFRIVRIVLDLWSEPTLVSSSIPIKE